MAMTGPGPGELAREVVDADGPLGAGEQVAELDLAGCELVAEDHREVRAVASGALELSTELPRRQLRPCDDPRRPQARRDRQPLGRRVGIGADDDGQRPGPLVHGCRRRSSRLLLEHEEDPIDAEPEADTGRRAATEELDEAVVPTAAAERLLLPLAPGNVVLERGAGVVVEATDE